MAEKVKVVGIVKEPNYLYFINKDGDIGRAKLSRAGRKKVGATEKEVVKQPGITKEAGYLYFLDKEGDISRAKMARGRK